MEAARNDPARRLTLLEEQRALDANVQQRAAALSATREAAHEAMRREQVCSSTS